MAKMEASLPKRKQDELDKIESTEAEDRAEAKVELKVVPSPEKEAESILDKSLALMKRFEGFVSKLESSGLGDEAKTLLEKAKSKHQEFVATMEEIKEQAKLFDKRTELKENVEKLHRSFNRARDKEDKKASLRGKIEQAEEAFYQARKPKEVDLAEHEKTIAELESDSEKIGGEFKQGETVKWVSDKGEELNGEIVGPAERIGSVIVKTEKNSGGFAIQKGKLEKFIKTTEERPFDPAHGDNKAERSGTAELIADSHDFESLVAAIEKAGVINGSDGKVYKAEILTSLIQDISKHLPEAHSPLMNLITRNEGLRSKVRELLQKKRLENKRQDFADKDVKLNREYGSITGWLKRALNSGGYLETKAARDEAYEAYAGERAEAVFANVEKMMNEQIELADSRAEAFNEAKGWGAKLYDVYKNNPVFKKLKQARLVAGLGLLGAGIAGAPVAATLGGGFIAWQLLGRGFGGVGAAVGSYDLMNMLARKSGTQVLSKIQESKLQEYNDEQGLSKFKRFFNKKVKVGDQEIGAKDLHEKKKLELETEHAKHLSNERLNELIEYYEAVVAADGKKPSGDPKYLMLMREKAGRFKKALAGENESIRDIVEGDAFDEIKQVEKIKLIDYLKQKFLVESVLFEKMKTAKGDNVERKNSKEYQGWINGQAKLQKQYDALTPELQTLVDRFIQSHKQPVIEMLDPNSSDELKGIKTNEIDEAGIWAADWKFNPVLADEVEDLLNKNELLRQAAAEAGAEQMKKFVSVVEGQDQKVEKKTAALLSFCEKNIQEAQKMIDDKRTEKGYSAVTWKKARQALAVLIGVGMGSGFIQQHIIEFLSPSVSAETMPSIGHEVNAHVSEAGGGVEGGGLLNRDLLEKSGVLRAGWQSHIDYSTIKNPAEVRGAIMAKAREIFLAEEALEQAQTVGNLKEFKLLQGALDQKIASAEKLYGNVFGEPPKLEPSVEVVQENLAQNNIEEPKASVKAADVEPAKASRIVERPKVENAVDAEPAVPVSAEEISGPRAEGVKHVISEGRVETEGTLYDKSPESLIKGGVLKDNWAEHVKSNIKNPAMLRTAVMSKARDIFLTEQALRQAKEAGDLKSFNLLKDALDKKIASGERLYGDVFGEPPKIEPPVGTVQPESEVIVKEPKVPVKAVEAEPANWIRPENLKIDQDTLIKAGVLKNDVGAKIMKLSINSGSPDLVRLHVVQYAKEINSMEQALLKAKEIGDVKGFKLLQEELEKRITAVEKTYGDIFEDRPKIDPPTGVASAESITQDAGKTSEALDLNDFVVGEDKLTKIGILKQDWIDNVRCSSRENVRRCFW